ncbi:MAG: competence/damage-inducible protein A [Deltaproteobacteria bacterium]|nr:MAG: competence/damage-inducible protein A [Deltaproteobacteria bacterium]
MSDTIQTAAIISTGDEVVGGRTVDTNAAFIAERLSSLAIETVCVLAVGDYSERIEWAWRRAAEQADLIVSTGGLGPTADDLTTETVARVAGVDLVLDETQAERIRQVFARVGRPMPDNNLRQAMIPAGAEVIDNDLGTAPGYRLVIDTGGRRVYGVVLPGVPREMKAMIDERVLPWLASMQDHDRHVLSRTFQTFGMSESAVDEALRDLIDPSEGRVAFRASFPQISVRLTVTGNEEDARRRLSELGDRIAERLGPAVIAEGETTMEEVVGDLLRRAGKTLATAESCTGGLIGNRITNVAGSSDYYAGGIVAYSNDLKKSLLGVSRSTLAMFGAVSEETACEMASGARRATGADIAVATTGIAGPGGGTEEKPVGTVAVALAAGEGDSENVRSKTYRLWGNREWVKVLTSQVALDWVRRYLVGLDPLDSGFGRRAPRS